jgi:hypothetical protein
MPPAGTPAEAPAGAAGTKPWYRGPLLAVPILAALIVIALVVGGAAVGVAALSHGGSGHPVAVNTARPTARPTAKPAPSQTPGSFDDGTLCWDGSTPTSGNCPALTGEDALHWVFPLATGAPDFTCEAVDPTTFEPAAALDLYQCAWTDLPGTYVFLGRWSDSTVQAGWMSYMQGEFSNTVVSRFLINGEDSGISLVGSSDAGLETVYGYDVAPFFSDVETDLSKGGTASQEAIANARLLARPVHGMQLALDAASH